MSKINESIKIIEDQEEYINMSFDEESSDVIYSPVGEIEFSTRIENLDINNMTYAEVLEYERRLIRTEMDKKVSPKPITFRSSDGYDTKIKSLNSDGFISNITISSDMDINKGY